MTKEEIYDEKVMPLVDKLYDICKENDIQMIVSCCLKVTEEEEIVCTSYCSSEADTSENLIAVANMLR